jgi:alkanesulfonate monooxygenase SsuD/methylene tetrahydromethanopterin reductase-like flavin-dependent oxidoreductase (luciferase family)
MLPLPAQKGGPPIWVSGRSAAAIRRAARLGDGFHPYMYTAERCRIAFREVRAAAREVGRELPADYVFAIFQYVSLGDDAAEARDRGVRELTHRYAQPFDQLVDKYCLYGPPARILDGLRAYAEAGVCHFILAPVMAPDRRRQALERYAAELLPELRRMTPAPVA